LSYCHDYEFLLRVIKRYGFFLFEERLLRYRLHEGNTIRQNEFLRHLEILFAIFKTTNIEEILSWPSVKEREEMPVFKALSRNPEINQYIRLSEIGNWLRELQSLVEEREGRLKQADEWLKKFQAIAKEKDKQLKEADGWLQEKNQILQEADVWLRELQSQVKERDERLREADGWLKQKNGWLVQQDEKLKEADAWLKELQSKVKETDGQISELQSQLIERARQLKGVYQHVENLQVQIETKEGLLQEIFESKGWRWLTRFREIKRRFSFQRGFQLRRSENREDDKTYHAKILHPVQSHRPKVIYAIANFMTGGSSRLVVDLIEHLGHKYDQEVIAYFIPSRAAYAGFPVHDFSGSVTSEEIALFLRKRKAEILHIHYWGEGDIYWYKKIFNAAEKYSCAVIENVNTPVAPFISDSVDQYIYVSEYAMNYTTPVAGKACFIHPGSNLSMFSRNGAPIPDDAIGMVYRLELDKLKEDSIQVFIEVVKRRPKTKVYIVGGGSLMDSYKTQLAEHGVSGNFEMPGFVVYHQLPDYYRKLSLFVAPVWKESFGQVSSFAMGMEIPVVGYKVGALPEILGTDEFLARDTKELTEMILRLLDDREKRLEIGAYNYARVHELFSVEKMVEKYDLLYCKMLENW
jgi:glycosyltransferase involved in cell wall biosynthesis